MTRAAAPRRCGRACDHSPSEGLAVLTVEAGWKVAKTYLAPLIVTLQTFLETVLHPDHRPPPRATP